jgi:hypothetical protein
MPAKKRTKELVEQLVNYVFVKKMSLREAAKKAGVARSVVQKALRDDAVNYNFITREQHDEYVKSAPARGVIRRNEIYTQTELSFIYSNAGIKSASNGLKESPDGLVKLVEQARKGGLATQEKHSKRVGKNLRKAKPYGSTACRYNDMWFDSQGERITALLLKSYGLLEDIIIGQNFQKEFGRMRVDFYINNSLIVEYHPIPKQDFSRSEEDFYASTSEAYAQNRLEKLKPYLGEDAEIKLIVISAPSGKFSATEFYTKLGDMGITDTWPAFLEKFRKVRSDIDVAEKQYALDLKELLTQEEPPF